MSPAIWKINDILAEAVRNHPTCLARLAAITPQAPERATKIQ